MRHVLNAMLLVSAALALTACGPDDNSHTHAAGSSASASAPASANSAAPSSSAPAKAEGGVRLDKNGCPILAEGHRFVHITNVNGAMGTVVGQDAKMACNRSMNEGASFRPVGGEKEIGTAASIGKVTIITKNGQETRSVKDGALAHVQVCADPNGRAGTAKINSKGEFCYGQNFYDVAVGSDGRITEMTELYGS